MSIDRSLKVKDALIRHRNVLKRDERIGTLKEEEKWSQGDSVFGLPKVAHRKSRAAKAEKEETAAATPEAGAAAETAAPAAGAAKAPAAKAPAAKADKK
jgi:small basic protein (TIGR04137 family)